MSDKRVVFGDPEHFWVWPDESLVVPPSTEAPRVLSDLSYEAVADDCKRLGSGCARDVFAFNDDYVLKVISVDAYNIGHQYDNMFEACAWRYLQTTESRRLFAPVIHASTSGKWLVMERVITLNNAVGQSIRFSVEIRDSLTSTCTARGIGDVGYYNIGQKPDNSFCVLDYAALRLHTLGHTPT